MKKGKTIIGIAFVFWASILTYITFFSHNPYLNTIVFFFGMMITICGLGYGCEKIEKVKYNK
jgi:hypothetical protein